jgi:ribosomal protein S16
MGQKKNRQGRFIEHLGNWQPIKRKTRDRTISLNKPRVLYWLAQGAEPCPKIKKFLSYIGYTPPVMHPLGRLTHYPKTNLKPTRYFDDKESYKRLRKYYSFHYNTYRAEEEEDKLYKEYLIASKGVLGDKIAQMTSMEQLNDTL